MLKLMFRVRVENQSHTVEARKRHTGENSKLLRTFAAFMFAVFPVAGNSGQLFEAARSDDRSAVARLIHEGADVSAREQDGATARGWAAMRSSIAVAELLLKAGANPNLTNELGLGPLSLAITNGSVAIADLLLNNGADPNVAREDGETPLMMAARLGQTDVVNLLLDRGADPHSVTTSWDVKYTIYAPTTVTLGKTGIPWNTDGDYTCKKGGQ